MNIHGMSKNIARSYYDYNSYDGLEGGAFFDIFKKIGNTIKRGAENVKNAFVPTFSRKLDDYLKKNGNWKIASGYIRRDPVESFVKVALNLITLGKFSSEFKKSFDEVYHLYCVLICVDENGISHNVKFEKNEVINIEDFKGDPMKEDDKQSQYFTYNNEMVTLFNMFAETEKRIGVDKFIRYDPVNNNCQNFIYNNIVTLQDHKYNIDPEVKTFIIQDLAQALSASTQKIVTNVGKAVTGLAAFGKRLIGGGEEIQVILLPIDEFTPTQAKNWIRRHDFNPIKVTKEKNYYHLRLQEPKSNAKYYTKVLNNGVHLVLMK